MTAPQTSNNASHSPLSTMARLRGPGLLFATVAMTLMLPGALSVDAPAAELPQVAPEPIEAEPMAGDDGALPAADSQAAAPTTEAADTLSFRTGDRLTQEQLAEFDAYVAALKAQGQHRGISHW